MSRKKTVYEKVSVRVPGNIKSAIEQEAKLGRRSFNKQIVLLLEKGFDVANFTPSIAPADAITSILSLRLPVGYRQRLESLAEENHRSLSQQTLVVIEAGLLQS